MAYPLGRRLGDRALLPIQYCHDDGPYIPYLYEIHLPTMATMAMAGWVEMDGTAALSP
jgi:hypothetical protein